MTSPVRMKINGVWYVVVAVLITAMLAVIYACAPDQYSFYPRCFFYVLTGWQCPGCGGLRATHSLLHGDVGAAFAYNPLLVSLAPIALVAACWAGFQKVTGKPLRWPIKLLWLLLCVCMVFTVVRNVPGAFSL